MFYSRDPSPCPTASSRCVKCGKTYHLTLQEGGRWLPETPLLEPDQLLQQELEEGLPLVLARGSEKARSEWITNPVRRQLKRQVSLFSGEDFTVDASLGLNGICDFLISRSPTQLEIEAPAVVIVEAKKEHLNGVLGQCIVEMVAAQTFNQANERPIPDLWLCEQWHQANERPIPVIYGSVSSGTSWKFLKLEGKTVTIDLTEYPLPPIELILGFLVWMVEEG